MQIVQGTSDQSCIWNPQTQRLFGQWITREEYRYMVEQQKHLLPGEYGTYKTVKARFWPWLSGKRP